MYALHAVFDCKSYYVALLFAHGVTGLCTKPFVRVGATAQKSVQCQHHIADFVRAAQCVERRQIVVNLLVLAHECIFYGALCDELCFLLIDYPEAGIDVCRLKIRPAHVAAK